MNEYRDIDPAILMKHIEQAYYEHLENQYTNDGFNIFRNYTLEDGVEVDFMAKKDDYSIIIEVKTGKYTKEKREKSILIKKHVDQNRKNTEFKVIFLNPPQYKEIRFDKLKYIILSKITDQELAAELNELATHCRIEGVSDVEIDGIEIEDDQISISGNGLIEVNLQYGSDSDLKSDEGDAYSDSFPFKYDLFLTKEFEATELDYSVDTSGFYE